MEKEIETFRDNVDSWIKQIRREFADFSDIPSLVTENADNVQHNYELIYELKDEIEELKQEINALKLIQIISLKQKASQKAEQPQS
jgi:cell division septum initiation protein DivIVA